MSAEGMKPGADQADWKTPDTGTTVETETLEQRKERIDKVWEAYEAISNEPELTALFSRKDPLAGDKDPRQILEEQGYPERSKIGDLEFETWTVELNPKFCKDGFMYLLRGDHPGLDKKGLYAFTYGYGKLNTQQLAEALPAPEDVAYFLYHNEAYLKAPAYSKSTAQQLATLQSAVGRSSFISTTTNLPCAVAGTGNQPDLEEQKQYEVYILKIPTDCVINRNGLDQFGLNEEEYLIPDRVDRDEIIAKFLREQPEQIYEYMNQLLGVTKEDLGVIENPQAG